jgi:hypothetical protein
MNSTSRSSSSARIGLFVALVCTAAFALQGGRATAHLAPPASGAKENAPRDTSANAQTNTFAALIANGGVTARASEPELKDFHHTAWTSENGLGAVFDIQQASDGYLWLMTSQGVDRFDGVRFQPLDEATNGAVHSSELTSFFLSSSGGVWLTTRAAGLLLWKDGKVTSFPDRRCTPALQAGGFAEDRDGSLWIQASVGLSRLRGPVCEQIGANFGYPGGFPKAILLDRAGTLWVKMANGPLLFLQAGQSKFEISPRGGGATANASFLHQAGDGSIWLSDDHGIRRVDSYAGVPPVSNPLSGGDKGNANFGDFTFAADDSMWAVTSEGVRHFDHSEQWKASAVTEKTPAEIFTPAQGLSSDAAWEVLVDREGSIWVGTNSGLDRLRRTALSMVTLPHVQEHQFSVAVGDRGSIWTGNASLPLTHVAANGSITTFPKTHQTNCVRRDRNGTIWSAGEGDAHLWRFSGAELEPVHYPNEEIDDVVAIAVDRNNDPWISTINRNVFRLVQGTWINQNEALGKKPGVLGTMTADTEGNIWFGFSSAVVRWDGSIFQKGTISGHTVSETTISVRGEHVWLAGLGGVQLYSRGQSHTVRWQNEEMPGRVYGVVETTIGDLWMNGSSGITHISRGELEKWLRDPTYAVSGERLEALDGLSGLSVERFPEPSVVEAPEGRLWFATNKGIVSLDPAALDRNRNRIPPPVTISSIVSNGKTFSGSSHLGLPAHTERLEIDYTALSLAIPERVLFRYKLDGIDTEWQSAGTRRQAFYTNLHPGQYRFHVIACNNDGVWNDVGANVDFTILPAWYQTIWFRALCVVVFLLLIWMVYQLRLKQLEGQFNMALEARVDERTRIARDLHDTLLQSFQGLTLHFQRARNLLPERTPEAILTLDKALDGAERAIVEGRDAIHDLRSPAPAAKMLAEEITTFGEELVAKDANEKEPVQFRIVVEGSAHVLNPNAHIHIFRIAREALRNAFSHSQGRRIETEIAYTDDLFRLRIRDDGKGIDPDLRGRAEEIGHWGLRGMRERAECLNGELDVWSEPGAGTEIELRIPGSIAYEASPSHSSFQPFWKRRKNGNQQSI